MSKKSSNMVYIGGDKQGATLSVATKIEDVRIFRSTRSYNYVKNRYNINKEYRMLPKKVRESLASLGILTVGDLQDQIVERLEKLPGIGYAIIEDLKKIAKAGKVTFRKLKIPRDIVINLTIQERSDLEKNCPLDFTSEDLVKVLKGTLYSVDFTKTLQQQAKRDIERKKAQLEKELSRLNKELKNVSTSTVKTSK